ncbi:hypothetical protein EJ04DRAFT_520354 [Polyplosphaeria fusca]|uniref:Uncharacterized protein n=1 Tax=Polyplosphaeria fusca TaxID=682080 RepID=A0A9P4V7F4_9PLEO|nr:hypothetical protein EJ04DRAFT_520354 [Polyplosphaeria fusca]
MASSSWSKCLACSVIPCQGLNMLVNAGAALQYFVVTSEALSFTNSSSLGATPSLHKDLSASSTPTLPYISSETTSASYDVDTSSHEPTLLSTSSTIEGAYDDATNSSAASYASSWTTTSSLRWPTSSVLADISTPNNSKWTSTWTLGSATSFTVLTSANFDSVSSEITNSTSLSTFATSSRTQAPQIPPMSTLNSTAPIPASRTSTSAPVVTTSAGSCTQSFTPGYEFATTSYDNPLCTLHRQMNIWSYLGYADYKEGPCLYSHCLASQSSSLASQTAQQPSAISGHIPYIPMSPPCCGKCFMEPTRVEFLFWDDQVGAPHVNVSQGTVLGSTYVDTKAGMTYTSPSVYISFHRLGATDYCSTIGQEMWSTIIGFDLKDISTVRSELAPCLFTVPPWKGTVSAEIATLRTYPITLSDLVGTCVEKPKFAGDDPCKPLLAFPTKLAQLQPEWAGCGAPNWGGYYDPPKTLHVEPELIPTTKTSLVGVTQSATPGQTLPSIPENTDPGSEPTNAPVNNPGSSPAANPNTRNGGSGPMVTFTFVHDNPSSQPAVTITHSTTTTPPTFVVTAPSSSSAGQPAGPAQTFTLTAADPVDPSHGPESTVLVVGGQTLTAGAGITVGGTTSKLPNGQSVTSGGIELSLDLQGSSLIIGASSTVPLAQAQITEPPRILTLGSETFTANAGHFSISGQVLVPGNSITVGGTTITRDGTETVQGDTELYLDPQGTIVLVDRQSAIQLAETSTAMLLTLAGEQYTRNSASQLVIDGQTLVPGESIVVSGTTLYLSPSATEVVIDGTSTIPLTPAMITGNAQFYSTATINGVVYTIDETGRIVIGSQTLTPGSSMVIGATTVTLANGEVTTAGGTTISLELGATRMIIDGTTFGIAIPTVTASQMSDGLGVATTTPLPGQQLSDVEAAETGRLNPSRTILTPGQDTKTHSGGARFFFDWRQLYAMVVIWALHFGSAVLF